jgi:hypothetical protein
MTQVYARVLNSTLFILLLLATVGTSMFALRQVLPYPIIALFILFFFSDSLSDRIKSFTSLSRNRGNSRTAHHNLSRFVTEPPDFSLYQQLRTLPANQFPLGSSGNHLI